MDSKSTTGELKDLLIANGLVLLNQVGYEKFSIRKVAVMCGVSHAAPYKHYKNKDELIAAISILVVKKFRTSLEETSQNYDDPKIRLIELGKKYVQFMVENPEYMKFLFFSPNKYSVKITNNHFVYNETDSFAIFKNTASAYLDSIGTDSAVYTQSILGMWSVVHGISMLISEQRISIDTDYLSMVSDMLNQHLELQTSKTNIVI